MIPRLHVVTDDQVLARSDVVDVAGRILDEHGGAVAVHIRGPSSPGRLVWDIASRVHRRSSRGALFVNDRVDVALALPGSGVHLRGSSLPADVVRGLIGASRALGRSVRAHAVADPSHRDVDPGPVDFLIAGSAFATRSHPGAPVAGVQAIGRVARAATVPVLAIGGISADRIGVLLDAGVYGVAVLRAVWGDADPVRAVGDLLVPLRGTASTESDQTGSA